MAIERKPMNTVWSSKEHCWKIYITPDDPDLNLTIPLSKGRAEDVVHALREKIHKNDTYLKFFNRLDENYKALLAGKDRTQQKEGGILGSYSR